MKHPLRLACVLLLLVAPTAPAMAPESAPGPGTSGGITEIVLERAGCRSCPADTLVLRPNGKAGYTGKANTRLTGEYAGTFWPGDFDRLAHWLVSEGFFQLAESPDDMVISDDSTEVVHVTRDGQRKSVFSYKSAQPLQLWSMVNLIRSFAADIQWEPAHSGIRGQVLWKAPGEEWRALPEEYIRVAAAGTGVQRTYRTDHEGRFEINLAPGTYSVTWRMDPGNPLTVVVEPDRFPDVNFRLDVAARNAANQYRELPPPPGDGLYVRASSMAARWMLRESTEEIRLGERSERPILAKRLISEGPDNSTFHLALTVPYDEKDQSLTLFSLFLIVGNTAYRPLGTIGSAKVNPVVYFKIPGEELARKVAGIFDIPVEYFSRPEYKLGAAIAPTKQSFRRGEPVTAALRIVNNGVDHIRFDNSGIGSERDKYSFSARRSGQPVTDISFAGDRSGTATLQYLAPGATFEDTVNLGKWFEFTEAGTYEVRGSFKLDIHDSRYQQIGLDSWTEYAPADFVVTIE